MRMSEVGTAGLVLLSEQLMRFLLLLLLLLLLLVEVVAVAASCWY